MRVAVLPDWRRDNPYQRLLAEALAPLGVECVFPQGYRRVLPLSRALLPRPRPDLLHLHWPTPYLRDPRPVWRALYCERTLLDIALVRRAGIPVVWTVHNLVTHDTPTPALERRFSRRLARLADGLIVHSEAARAAVISELGADDTKIAVISHGPLTDAYGPAPDRAAARAALGLPSDVPVALFFGMIRPYKGVPDLLRAWEALGARRGEAVLLIAGSVLDEAYGAEIAEMAAKLPSVRLDLRFVPDAEVPMLMAAADVLVLPFAQSLTSGTVRLALDYGVPVVAPKLPGTAEEAGVIYTQGNLPEDIGKGILSAFSSKEARPGAPDAATWAALAGLHKSAFLRAARSGGAEVPA